MAINVLDLDVTKDCNLRCVYCFKSERVHGGAASMTLPTAMAAIDWLVAASYGAPELWVNLMGGEPLLQFPMLTKLVPYAKRRAASHGKTVQFGCTTNLTLVDEEVAAFFRRWGMGWHCSIDGSPAVQNRLRPGPGGLESATQAERGARQVLKDRPAAMARATVTAELVGTMFDSLLYFEGLGFVSFGFALAEPQRWRAADLAQYDVQMGRIREHARDNWYRRGVDKWFGALDFFISAHVSGARRLFSCGAGRGTVLIDERGDIWPCHRWDGADHDARHGGAWRLGNIFAGTFDHMLHLALLERDCWSARTQACAGCPIERICAGGCPAANLADSGSVYHQNHTICRAARIAHKHALLLHDELYAERNELLLRKFYDPGYQHPDSFSAPPSGSR
jgi:uncharacterized protein